MIDSKDIGQSENFTLTLVVDYDPWADTRDDDGLTPKQIEAWKNDEWCYVTATLTASRAGIELGEDSLCGLEYGTFTITDDSDNVVTTKEITIDDIYDYVGLELSGEAVSKAQEKLTELMKGTK